MFVLCIRGLSDFHYLAQSRSIDSCTLTQISTALNLFHQNKKAILDTGARVGKGNKPLDHFFIPKLELLHSVVTSIYWSSVPTQWSADPTERAHIDVVKIPSENTNNGQYGPHICRYLDRDERGRLFDLSTAICKAGDNLESILYSSVGGQGDRDDEEPDGELNENWIAELDTVITACGPSRKSVDLFATADTLVARSMSEAATTIPLPLRTFSTSRAAFNLNRKPDIPQISINSVAEMFNLPDLCPALLNFFAERLQDSSNHHIGGCRRAQTNTQLPFDDVMVWFSLRTQTRSMDDQSITDPCCLSAVPPSDSWPLGRYDTMLLVDDSSNPSHWGQRGYYPGSKF